MTRRDFLFWVVQWVALVILVTISYLVGYKVFGTASNAYLLFPALLAVFVGVVATIGIRRRAARSGGLGCQAAGEVDWRADRATVLAACVEALSAVGARDIRVDVVAGTLRARRGVSRRSWGEVLLVRISPPPDTAGSLDALAGQHVTITSRWYVRDVADSPHGCGRPLPPGSAAVAAARRGGVSNAGQPATTRAGAPLCGLLTPGVPALIPLREEVLWICQSVAPRGRA